MWCSTTRIRFVVVVLCCVVQMALTRIGRQLKTALLDEDASLDLRAGFVKMCQYLTSRAAMQVSLGLALTGLAFCMPPIHTTAPDAIHPSIHPSTHPPKSVHNASSSLIDFQSG